MDKSTAKPTRPASVTFLALGVLMVAGFFTSRIFLSLMRWQFLSSLPDVHPGYITITGIVMAGLAWTVLWGVWRRKRYTPTAARLSVFLFTLYIWGEQIWLHNRDPVSRFQLPENWIFRGMINLVSAFFVFWVLSRPKAKAYFGENNERKS